MPELLCAQRGRPELLGAQGGGYAGILVGSRGGMTDLFEGSGKGMLEFLRAQGGYAGTFPG